MTGTAIIQEPGTGRMPPSESAASASFKRCADNPWLLHSQGAEPPACRIFCFPYAGGAASVFKAWPLHLPASWEVCAIQLPGRGFRLRERPQERLIPLARDVAAAIGDKLDLPFVFFGHSMGALLAFEVARQLRSLGATRPLHVVVSAHRPPDTPQGRRPIHDLPDADFLDELRRLDGFQDEILENFQVLELILPILRADVAACETYVFSPGESLDCPIFALAGSNDAEAPAGLAPGWARHTTGGFGMAVLPGGHFFLHSCLSQLTRLLTSRVRTSDGPDQGDAAGRFDN